MQQQCSFHDVFFPIITNMLTLSQKQLYVPAELALFYHASLNTDVAILPQDCRKHYLLKILFSYTSVQLFFKFLQHINKSISLPFSYTEMLYNPNCHNKLTHKYINISDVQREKCVLDSVCYVLQNMTKNNHSLHSFFQTQFCSPSGAY